MSRPYLEVKVVKVKKKEQKEIVKFRGKKYIITRNKLIGKTYLDEYKGKSKGNWVNGENLDKIKFPCFCSYKYGTGTHYGMITRTRLNLNRDHYTLHGIDKQHDSYSSIKSYPILEGLIENYDIHILKGKIIIFDDTDDTDEKYDIDIEEE